MGYNAWGWGTLHIESENLSKINDKWNALLNAPVASDECDCRLSKWRDEIKPCEGSHKTYYENNHFYPGGQTLEQYSAYSFESIAELFGLQRENAQESETLYDLHYEDGRWDDDEFEILVNLLSGYCKEGDNIHFEGDDGEQWMYLYKDGKFSCHGAVIQVLYPTAYKKDAELVEYSK